MEEISNMICVTCPKGCSLVVKHDGTLLMEVTNTGCKRGVDYARNELTDPRRNVTTTVGVRGGIHPLLPVYTSAPFPKGRIFDLLNALRGLKLEAPVKMGDPILANALGTGIDILASRNVEKIA